MPEEEQRERDLEVLRALYGQWARGDFSAAAAFTEDVVWVPLGGPETGIFTGIEELTESWRAFLQSWKTLRVEAEEIVPGPVGKYVVMQVFRGTGRASGVETESKTAVVVTMREGKIARMEGYWERQAALRAAAGEIPP